MNAFERLQNWVNSWTKSYTGSFTPSNMMQLLYSRPADIAHNLAHGQRNGSLRTNALLEYTQRGEWMKAAQVARALALGAYPWVVEEIKTVFGQEGAARLLDAPLGTLPTVLYSQNAREEVVNDFDVPYHVVVVYVRTASLLCIHITKPKELFMDVQLSTPTTTRIIVEGDARAKNPDALSGAILRLTRELNEAEVAEGRDSILGE